jgi:hypothetical protein
MDDRRHADGTRSVVWCWRAARMRHCCVLSPRLGECSHSERGETHPRGWPAEQAGGRRRTDRRDGRRGHRGSSTVDGRERTGGTTRPFRQVNSNRQAREKSGVYRAAVTGIGEVLAVLVVFAAAMVDWLWSPWPRTWTASKTADRTSPISV